MTSRPKVVSVSLLTAVGLTTGGSMIAVGGGVAGATAPREGTCPTGSQMTVPSICEVSFNSTGTSQWTVPTGVTMIQELTVGAGGGGGGGSGYAPGGGGGGGAVKVCTTVVKDLTKLSIAVGAGGAKGTGSATIGTAGANGTESRVATGATIDCSAKGGGGGGAGYYQNVAPGTPTIPYGQGGVSGSGKAGGSASGLVTKNPGSCLSNNDYYYNFVATGGGSDAAVGNPRDGNLGSGNGANGTTPTTGLFYNEDTMFGAGGGGGGGADCVSSTLAGGGGVDGGGRGGTAPAGAAHDGVSNDGGGGGGGAGIVTGNYGGLASNGGMGGSGYVEIRFSAIYPANPSASVYFASGSSTLTTADQKVITSFAKAIEAGGNSSVTIKGYADTFGPKKQNVAFSIKRAQVTAAYLKTALGSQASHFTISAQGMGPTAMFGAAAKNRVAKLTSSSPIA